MKRSLAITALLLGCFVSGFTVQAQNPGKPAGKVPTAVTSLPSAPAQDSTPAVPKLKPPVADAPPALTEKEKTDILLQQRQVMSILLQISELKEKYADLSAQQQAANKKLQDAIGSVQKRIGPAWQINPDTLETVRSHQPPPPAEDKK